MESAAVATGGKDDAAATIGISRHEGQQDRSDSHYAHGSHGHEFAVDTGQCRWDMLQRFKRPEKVPFRADTGWRRRERVGLRSQLPWVEGRKSSQHCQNRGPGEQVAQKEVRQEGDSSHYPGIGRPITLDRRGDAHAVSLDEQEVQSHQGCGNSWKYCHVKAE